MDKRKIFITVLAVAFLIGIFSVFQILVNMTDPETYIDNRVDKILWKYEDMIIENGYFHDRNDVKYSVKRVE
jgi:hypothetical protein